MFNIGKKALAPSAYQNNIIMFQTNNSAYLTIFAAK